jgi:1,5-anhydro-D-fructose reductase (1,5-anhydro-D-mannitol-forming)
MEKKIKWGIIGCGDVTEAKSGPAFNMIKGSELVSVMRRNGAKAKNYATRHGVPKWYDDADLLINDPDVNAVYVATPPGSHAEYAIKAMQAGKPVYVEKPMAATYGQCLEMNRVSKETGIPLVVAYYRRMLPGFRKVKDLIDSGVIGKPIHFFIRYFTPPRQEDFNQALPWRVIPSLSGGGYLYDLGSHQLDLIDYLLGPIEIASGVTSNQLDLYEPEDFVSAGFVCNNGVTGSGVWSFAAPAHLYEDHMEISGEKGRISFSCFEFSQTILSVDGVNTYIDNPRPDPVQLPLIETVVRHFQGTGICLSDGDSAARTNKVLDILTKKNDLVS